MPAAGLKNMALSSAAYLKRLCSGCCFSNFKEYFEILSFTPQGIAACATPAAIFFALPQLSTYSQNKKAHPDGRTFFFWQRES